MTQPLSAALGSPSAVRSIATPCVKVCMVDPGSGFCLGCGRTLPEIAQWTRFTPQAREAIMDGLGARLDALAAAGKL
jgi:hypothetical protein